jgi:hypothetical protein
MRRTHAETLRWVRESASAGHPWVVSQDEIGPAKTGVKPDAEDPDHDDVRRHALWGNLMAGGAGSEWYFGYDYPNSDLTCEDWRSRDNLWDLTRYALEFFHMYLPFAEMRGQDELVTGSGVWCLAKPGEIYAVYIPQGGITTLEIPEGAYSVEWYNPREGGPLTRGRTLKGPGKPSLGSPPDDPNKDWAALVRRTNPGRR